MKQLYYIPIMLLLVPAAACSDDIKEKRKLYLPVGLWDTYLKSKGLETVLILF